MDYGSVPLFALADRRLAWLEQRQGALSRNIANIDTPSFHPTDLQPFAAALARTVPEVAPVRTDPGHLAGTLPATGFGAVQIPAEQQPDGNAVSLDDQLVRMADTDTAHELVGQLYTKYLSMFRTAIGR
jgi:flagellar basal-body rod protein FlgB